MNKTFTSLLALLFLSVASAWADAEPLSWSEVKDGYTYAIVNVQPASVNKTYYLNSTNGNLTPVDASSMNANSAWPETAQFVAEKQTDGKFAFKNVANGLYLAYKSHNTGENSMKGFVSTVEAWSSWTMNKSSRSGYEGTYYPVCQKRTSTNSTVSTLLIANNGSWNAWSAGECTNTGYSNNYGFVELVDVTFNLTGAATGSVTVKIQKGGTPAIPFDIPSYVTAQVSPAITAANTSATYTVTTSYTSAMPFEPNGEGYYALKMNRPTALDIFVDGTAIKTVSGTTVTVSNQDNYKWQFKGDWLNGFALYNKAADQYVTYGSVNPTDKYTATLTDAPAEGAYFDLIINGGMNYLKIHGTTNNAYISNNGGAGTTFLTNWNSTSNIGDRGAQILIEEAQNIDKWDVYKALHDQIKAVSYGSGLGQYANVAIPGNADGETINGMLDSYESDYQTQNDASYEQNMEELQWILDNRQLNIPTPGTFLRIKGAATGTYISANGTAGAQVPLTSNANEAVLYYNNNGQLVGTLCGRGLTGTHSYSASASIEKHTFTEAPYAKGAYLIKSNYSGSKVLVDWNDGKLNRWGTENDVRSTWYVEEVDVLPVKISAAGYATLYAPVALQIPADVKAYALTEQDGYLSANQISEVIPAETGVIIEGEEGTYSFPITTGGSGTSCLSGTESPMAAPTGIYTLGTAEGIGFYKYTGAMVAGFKAYFQNSADVKGFNISFSGNESAIHSITTDAPANAPIYNMAGQRVKTTQKGIYIVGGKKVLK